MGAACRTGLGHYVREDQWLLPAAAAASKTTTSVTARQRRRNLGVSRRIIYVSGIDNVCGGVDLSESGDDNYDRVLSAAYNVNLVEILYY